MLFALTFSILGCKNVDPAPENLDALAHYYWDHFDDADDDAVAGGVLNLHVEFLCFDVEVVI